MIKFTTINVDGVEITRTFNTIEEIGKEWYSENCDLPSNDDKVVYAAIDGIQLHYPTIFEELLDELGVKENFKEETIMETYNWKVEWMTTEHGGNGVYYSNAETVKEAIEECKQEYMYHRYTGELVRPDLKITDIWKFVQYGE